MKKAVPHHQPASSGSSFCTDRPSGSRIRPGIFTELEKQNVKYNPAKCKQKLTHTCKNVRGSGGEPQPLHAATHCSIWGINIPPSSFSRPEIRRRHRSYGRIIKKQIGTHALKRMSRPYIHSGEKTYFTTTLCTEPSLMRTILTPFSGVCSLRPSSE